LGVITEGKRSKEGVCNDGMRGCGSACEAESEPHGTATLLRCTVSAVEKSLPEKCLLHKYLLCKTVEESIVQDIPNFHAHTKAL
jgi:hypothetical protein